jgi:hypothetical protein
MHHNTHLYKLNRLTFIGCIAEQRKKAKGGKGEGLWRSPQWKAGEIGK